LVLAALSGCGGGIDDESQKATPGAARAETDAARAGTVFRGQLNAALSPTEFPLDAHLKGVFAPVANWPLIAAHAVLMPDGRVLSYGTDGNGTQTGFFIYDIWDPKLGLGPEAHLTLPNTTNTDVFCSSQLVLPQGGGVFVAGGDNWTGTGTTNTGNRNSNVMSYEGNYMTRGNDMNRARWYSSSTTLLNGEIYIQGGNGGTDRPEIRGIDGTFRLLSTATTSGFDFMYPRNFVAPDGRLFGFDSAGRMYYVDASGTGSVTQVGQFASAHRGNDASAAMFAPGRILQFGGNSNQAIVIDITGGTPVITPTQSLSSQRRLVNSAILPNGHVMASGGSQVWNELTGVNNTVEIWNPQTGSWTQGATGVRARLYHSVSLLLPDATVMVGGGGAPGPERNLNVELYYPPYLFTADGQFAPRPTIGTAPTVLDVGRTFEVELTTGIAQRVVLVKAGSVTHSWNMEQRFVELAYSAEGSQLSVQAPTRAADAPPGFYMLFVLDTAGVPSIAKMVRINVAAVPNPAIVPSITTPSAQSAVAGAIVDLPITASDPNGDTLRFAATGLPPGLAIDRNSGRITGRPTAPGSYNVAVTVSDGVNAASAQFDWTVTDAPPLAVVPPPANPPVVLGTAIMFSASAVNGFNPRFRWDFGDGTTTAWSSAPEATHQFTAPGVYQVTVTAVDDRGIETRQTFLQAVHLPLTAAMPTASASIAIEPRSGGAHRAWVVNPDTNTVSAFDLPSRSKLAEIAVGTEPRTVAVAPNGTVWVVNKRSQSISVINASTFALQRTISLPRGSQPFGIAIAPNGAAAYVALEATGQVMRYNTSTYGRTATLAVGQNVRHVSVSADGTRLFVSRFVTPPLPGEHTASVQPRADTGGELVVVDAVNMTVLQTVVLAHSDKEDNEVQGRGVPNYLGAAALSPDGTQAWIPSKQDNVLRGALRDGTGLNFQSTVRAVSSRVDLALGREDLAGRIDHDNASLASAAAFDPRGVYLFVALETSREVVIVDAHRKFELFRIDVGRAPQGLAVSPDGKTLVVDNFMDRSIGIYDLQPLLAAGKLNSLPLVSEERTIGSERLTAQILLGKQLFYDARDPRLARDRYMSCASCHNDGGHDGRTWDLTGFGEGLRNTASLRGRAGTGSLTSHGGLHWTNNFDELQDFEGQIRALAGGTGLMTDADFFTGTRSQPLGDRKTGLSAELDALAAYVGSLATFDISPFRPGSNKLTADATAGRDVFAAQRCGICHAGTKFSGSGDATLSDIGSIKPSSGSRLYGALIGLDVPTLRDVWSTAPYLHDGSAPTLTDAVRAHHGVELNADQLRQITAYLRELGREEGPASAPVGEGTGLVGRYFNNMTLSGNPVFTREENIDFNWKSNKPAPGVNANGFSVRWNGELEVPVTGTYYLQTVGDDGIRLYVNQQLLVNRWVNRTVTTDTTVGVNLTAGQRVPIVLEYYDNTGPAVARLHWLLPGSTSYVAIPTQQMHPID
jgi:YVTN family beta-propeller protein